MAKAELEKENAELKKQLAISEHDREHNDYELTEVYKKIVELEKENAELKKNYEDSLVAYGVLKNKVELLSQPSPLESMQDVLITTQKVAYEKQKDQLTEAKEIIKEYIRINLLPPTERNFDDEVKLFTQAEDFIKE